MNWYPVDGAPINGTLTQFGAGSAALSLDSAANLLMARLCAGSAALLMAGVGTMTLNGAWAGASQMLMAGTGLAVVVQPLVGTAPLEMYGTANPGGTQQMAGAAPMEMFGSHGLPVPVTPGGWFAKRGMQVPTRQRAMVVPADPKVRDPQRERMPRPTRKRTV